MSRQISPLVIGDMLIPSELMEIILHIAFDFEAEDKDYCYFAQIRRVSIAMKALVDNLVSAMTRLPWILVGRIEPTELRERFPNLKHLRPRKDLDDATLAMGLGAQLLSYTKGGNYTVTGKGFATMRNLTSLSLAALKSQHREIFLDFESMAINDALLSLSHLTHLNLNNNSSLYLSDLPTSLLSLSLDVAKCVSEDVLSRLTQLVRLSIRYNDTFSGIGLAHLTALTELRMLRAILPQVTNTLISRLTKLRCLESNDRISGGVGGLLHLTCLFANYISSGKVMRDMQLRKLGWIRSPLGDSNCDFLNREIALQTSLCTLKLRDCKVGDRGILGLSLLTKLQCNNRVTDIGLQGLIALTHLDLSHCTSLCRVTDASVILLTNLRTLYLGAYHSVSDATLASLTSLRRLCISGNTLITDVGISTLTNLYCLDTMDANFITVEGLKPLVKLRRLWCNFRLDSIRSYLRQVEITYEKRPKAQWNKEMHEKF